MSARVRFQTLFGIKINVDSTWCTHRTLSVITMIKSLVPYTDILEYNDGDLYLESKFGPYVMRISFWEGD